MILGAKYGKMLEGKETYRDKIYGLTQELLEKFRDKQGTIMCKELIGFDPSKPDELSEARKVGVFTTKCPVLVFQAAEILEEILKEKPQKSSA